MVWLIALPLIGWALYLWASGHPAGIFAGFVPVMAGSFFIAFAWMDSEPTRQSSFWALCAGLALTVLPFTLRCIREQSVAEKQRRRNLGGGNANASYRVRLERPAD